MEAETSQSVLIILGMMVALQLLHGQLEDWVFVCIQCMHTGKQTPVTLEGAT